MKMIYSKEGITTDGVRLNRGMNKVSDKEFEKVKNSAWAHLFEFFDDVTMEVAKEEPVESEPKGEANPVEDLSSLGFQELKKKASELGINTHKMKRDEIQKAIEEKLNG